MKMGLKKRRRIQLIILAFLALGLATLGLGIGLRKGIQYYRSPSEVLAAPPNPEELFRIGGLVQAGSIKKSQDGHVFFSIGDGQSNLSVNYRGILPDLFAENQGAIALGRYQDGVFMATQILAKHDETYMPKELIETLKKNDVYRAGE